MALVPPADSEAGFAFADFALYPGRRRLERAGVDVRVGSRSLDILVALVARAGEIIAKDDLVALVWPNLIVEESALRVHISTLRKALGDSEKGLRLIANIPGRGYSFVAPVRTLAGSSASVVEAPVRSRLPTTLAKIIGRDEIIIEVAEAITTNRLVSIVGPGGIGKTTVALAVAGTLSADVAGDIVFVDLGQLSERDLVLPAVATALGLPVRSDDVLSEIVIATGSRRLLLLLDSCEHVIDDAASVAEQLLGAAPGVRILATSREALRAEGERVHRLQPLDLPPDGPALTAAEALGYSAVGLFVDRAAGVLGRYQMADADVPLVTLICKRLDGIALAIELATGRLDDMGIEALARSLEHSFQILTRGRRTALPRHQTLRGTIDWSYGILSDSERIVLMRISVFVGPFTPRAARAVAGAAPLRDDDVDEILHGLVAKSILSADPSSHKIRYRLLDTMRAYAGEKLEETTEAGAVRRCHALFYSDLDLAGTERLPDRRSDLLADGGLLGNFRAALDWAFSPAGDGSIGIALTINAIPCWFQLSLIDECIGRVQSALVWLERSEQPDPRARMHLHAALGFPQMRAASDFPSGAAAWQSVLEIAESIGDAEFQARALWALWADRINSGETLQSLDVADRLAALGRTDPSKVDALIAQRIGAVSKLKLGRLDDAHDDVDDMLARYAPADRREDIARFQYDQRSVARVTLARVLWLKGLADQAAREVEDNLADIAGSGHALSLAHVLSDSACFVALWRGDLDLAARHSASLRQHTSLQALDVWKMYADCFDGEVRIRRGDAAGGIAQLDTAIATLNKAGFVRYHSAFSGVLADSLRRDGRSAAALKIVDEVLATCARTGEAWCRPELLRIRAETRVDLGDPNAAQDFEEALTLANAQGAHAWRLRTATAWTNAARHGAAAGETVAARHLRSALANITEGFGTADVVAARSLLAAMA